MILEKAESDFFHFEVVLTLDECLLLDTCKLSFIKNPSKSIFALSQWMMDKITLKFPSKLNIPF